MKNCFVLILFINLIYSSYTFSQENYCFGKSGKVNSFIGQQDFSNSGKYYYYSYSKPLLAIENDLCTNIIETNNQKKLYNKTSFKQGSYTDKRDGKTYKTIKIGDQTWMAENLSFASPGNCWCYNDSDLYCKKYGRLYAWKEAKNACPPGWHLPTDDEWTILINNTGGEELAGGRLKSKTGWKSPNEGATDSIGFSALPGGYRFPNDTYHYVGIFGTWWTATEGDPYYAWNRGMTFEKPLVYRSYFGKVYGRSVRCLKN